MSAQDPPDQLPPRKPRPEPVPPEALGPGTDLPDGRVVYGVLADTRVQIIPPRDPASRDADMRRAREGCTRCAEIPPELITAIVAALRAAKGVRSA
jgi:hypothetical protein